jgi:hypothetical protein
LFVLSFFGSSFRCQRCPLSTFPSIEHKPRREPRIHPARNCAFARTGKVHPQGAAHSPLRELRIRRTGKVHPQGASPREGERRRRKSRRRSVTCVKPTSGFAATVSCTNSRHFVSFFFRVVLSSSFAKEEESMTPARERAPQGTAHSPRTGKCTRRELPTAGTPSSHWKV